MKSFDTFIRGLKHIRKDDWAWIHAKAAIGILCPMMAFVNPPLATRNGQMQVSVLYLVLCMLAVGGILSIIGLLLRGTRIKPSIVGYAFEMAGLIPLIAGPFFMSLIYLVTASQNGASLLGFGFTYALAAILFARYVDILIHRLVQVESKGVGLTNEGRT